MVAEVSGFTSTVNRWVRSCTPSFICTHLAEGDPFLAQPTLGTVDFFVGTCMAAGFFGFWLLYWRGLHIP